MRGNDPATLAFTVTWIGFWFNIPGVTLDPTQVVNDFFASGSDVVISGIDTTEGLVRAGQLAANGEQVWAIPYDFEGACEQAPDVCLGVPYFNWGPSYLEVAQSAIDGTFEAEFQWIPPDWSDINNPDTSIVGFVKGSALTPENRDRARRVHRYPGRRFGEPMGRATQLPGRQCLPRRGRDGDAAADLVHAQPSPGHGRRVPGAVTPTGAATA